MSEVNENINNNQSSINSDAPQLLEGVTEIRKCSFNPVDHFIKVRFKDSNDESYYLEVKWRMFWFEAYCAEKGIEDYSIEEQPATLIAGTSFIQACCVVRMNGKIAGQGVGGYNISGGNIDYAVQMAETIAKGRALANAGFGTVFTSAAAAENGGFEIPCDGGMRTSEFFRNPSNPMQIIPTGEKANTPVAPPRTDAPTNEAPVGRQEESEPKKMTRQDALKYTVPVHGKNFGVALGDLMAKDPNSVRYFATNTRYEGSELQEAARLVLNK